MAFPIRPFTEGMRPAPQTPDEAARHSRTYDAHKASSKAGDAVLRAGGSIEAANEVIQAVYAEGVAGTYAGDGKCHNSQPGWYGQECGKPAAWIGTKPNGFRSGFCQECREVGWERVGFVAWAPVLVEG